MGDTGLRRMSAGAAELLEGDVLAGHGLHDVGPGDEHVRRPLGHQHEVGHRRRVHRAAGAGTEDERELWDHAGCLDVAPEDLGVSSERDNAFLDSRATRVVDPDHRAPDLDGHVHDLADLLGEHLRERAAEDREVLGEHADGAAEDRSVAGDDGVAERPVLAHPEFDLAVLDEPVELDERARVEQQLDPLAGEELAVLTLPRDRPLRRRVRRGLAQLAETRELRLGCLLHESSLTEPSARSIRDYYANSPETQRLDPPRANHARCAASWSR